MPSTKTIQQCLILSAILIVVGVNVILLVDKTRADFFELEDATTWETTWEDLVTWKEYPERVANVKKLYVDAKRVRAKGYLHLDGLLSFKHLEVLEIEGSGFHRLTLPENLSELNQLQTLTIRHFRQVKIPEVVTRLKQLKNLTLEYIHLDTIPSFLFQLKGLEQLNLSNNSLLTLTDAIEQLQALRILDLSYNRLTNLPENIFTLSSLVSCDLSNNQLVLVENILNPTKHWPNLVQLNLSSNNVYPLVDSLWQLAALNVLDLSDNFLTDVNIPSNCPASQLLHTLNLSDNHVIIDNIASVGNLKALRELSLNECNIAYLPSSFQQLRRLNRLSLVSNRFGDIPTVVSKMYQLKLLTMLKNPIDATPNYHLLPSDNCELIF